jgi:hypothetical protein
MQSDTNVRHNVSKPWGPKIYVVDSFGRSEASLSCCSCARRRFCTRLIRRFNIVVIVGGTLCASITELLFEFLVFSTQLSDFVRLLDRTVVIAFANDELALLGVSTSATCRARLRSIALR